MNIAFPASLCWTKNVCNVKIRKDFDLDFILRKGDKVYKGIDKDRMLDNDELPSRILIEKSHFDIFIVRADDFFEISLIDNTMIDKNFLFSDNVTGIILFIEGYFISTSLR